MDVTFLSRIIYKEMNTRQAEMTGRGLGIDLGKWIFYGIIISFVSSFFVSFSSNILVFLSIEIITLVLASSSFILRFRDHPVCSFIESIPVSTKDVHASVTLLVAAFSITTTAPFPVALGICGIFVVGGATILACHLLLAIVACLASIPMSWILIRVVKPFSFVATRPRSRLSLRGRFAEPPLASFQKMLGSMLLHDKKQFVSLLVPLLLAILVLGTSFLVPGIEPVFAFFWLYVLTGFFPVFLVMGLNSLADQLFPILLPLPGAIRYSFRAKQVLSAMISSVFIAGCILFFSFKVSDVVDFLLISMGLFITNWVFCTLIVLITESISYFMNAGRKFAVVFISFNFFGTMFWLWETIMKLEPLAMMVVIFIFGGAWAVLLEFFASFAFKKNALVRNCIENEHETTEE